MRLFDPTKQVLVSECEAGLRTNRSRRSVRPDLISTFLKQFAQRIAPTVGSGSS